MKQFNVKFDIETISHADALVEIPDDTPEDEIKDAIIDKLADWDYIEIDIEEEEKQANFEDVEIEEAKEDV